MKTDRGRAIKDPGITAAEILSPAEIISPAQISDPIMITGVDAPVGDSDSPVRNMNTSVEKPAGSPKGHFLAWDKEYIHLKWGGPASIRNLQVYLTPEARVLDAGSGNGRYLGELSRHYTAVGVDISLTALCSSHAQLARNGRFAEHLGASVHALPFKSGAFGGILCYGVLQHLFEEERETAVREFYRLLSSGGFVFFEAFGFEDMRFGGEPSIPFEESTFVRQNGIIYHYFTQEEVKNLFYKFEVFRLENIKKEKIFRGKSYQRHMIRGVFRKI